MYFWNTLYNFYGREGIDNLTASKEVCFISNVSYPTYYPQSSQEIVDSGGFVNCNCGSKCVSDLGTCVRVITNSSGRMLHNSLPKIEKCTFTQTKCPIVRSIVKLKNQLKTL